VDAEDAAVDRREMVLHARGHAHVLGLGIAHHRPHPVRVEIAAHGAGSRRHHRHRQGGRAAEPRASRDAGVRYDLQAGFNAQRAEDVGGEGQASRPEDVRNGAPFGLGQRVLGLEADAVHPGLDSAPGPPVDRDVHRHRAGMEEIKGPDVQRAAGEIDPRRSGGFDCDTRHRRGFYATTGAVTILS
jgi:hypothetical protein